MKRLVVTVSLCAVLTALSSPSLGATQYQMFESAQLLQSGRPAEALSLLEANYSPELTSTQELFLLGMAAKESGAYSKAETYFRAALARDPGAGRIRMELAEVMFALGKLNAARAELATVSASNPPAQVLANIGSLISMVDTKISGVPEETERGPSLSVPVQSAPKKNWSAFVTVGLSLDSNVNAGPNTDTITLYGIPFALSVDAKETPDTGWFLRTGINYAGTLEGGTEWNSGINISVADYIKTNAFDDMTLSASTGPSFRLGAKTIVSAPLTFGAQLYLQQGDWYSQSWGIAPRLKYLMKDNLQFSVASSISVKRFNGDISRDSTSWMVSPSMNFQPNDKSNVAVGISYGAEVSGQDIYSNTVAGGYIGYQYVFSKPNIQAGLTASYSDTAYEGIQAAYLDARQDASRKVSADITYMISHIAGSEVAASASYLDNSSNLEINTFARSEFSLSFTKRF